jgi:DNA polymerase-3 subunit epsilon
MENIILVVDIETTGFLNQGGLIIEIGIVKLNLENGEISPAFNSLIREPTFSYSHTKGQFGWIFKNSDINPADIAEAPSLESQRDIIQFLFDKYYATAYNKEFDFGFLKDRNFSIKELPCPMLTAAPIINLPPDPGFTDTKLPSIYDAWYYFFENDFYLQDNRGLDDAMHEAKIVYKMYQLNLYDISLIEENKKTEITSKTENNTVQKRSLRPEYKYLNSKKKWGYIDKDKNIVIDFIFDYANHFSEGLAIIELDGKKGYIDETGKIVIPCIYKDAWSFHEGIACVSLNHFEYGYIDTSGKVIIPFIYNSFSSFYDGLACVIWDSRYGFIDKEGQIVINNRYSDAHLFKHGLAEVEIYDKENDENNWGIINKSDQEIFPIIYEDVKILNEKLIKIKQEGKYALADHKGKFLTSFKYDKIWDFAGIDKDIAFVKIGQYLGCINSVSDEIIPVKYRNYNEFKETGIKEITTKSRIWKILELQIIFPFG